MKTVAEQCLSTFQRLNFSSVLIVLDSHKFYSLECIEYPIICLQNRMKISIICPYMCMVDGDDNNGNICIMKMIIDNDLVCDDYDFDHGELVLAMKTIF